MNFTLTIIIGVILATAITFVFRILNLEFLQQPIGICFLILGMIDGLVRWIQTIRKAGGWKEWKLKMKKEMEERKELPIV